MKRFLFAALACTSLLTACERDRNNGKSGIFKGPEQVFHQGKAGTWVEIDDAGKPVRIGITIDKDAMSSLNPATGEPGHNHSNSLSLKFHKKASVTPFTHALLDWNPDGHEPAGIYDLPHFDFHFYTQSEAERLAIPLYEQDSLKFKNLPAAVYMPQTYVSIPGGVPQMGAHWVDFTTPELNGQKFTQTFLFGSFNGKVTFYEPMITKAFIDANDMFERAIPTPARFKETGYYPTKMRIVKLNGAVTVTLEDFVYRVGS